MAADLIPIQPEPEKGPAEQLVGLTYEESQILEFCREGKGRNEIANLTGLSTWKVSTVAAKHGHYFGRAAWLEVANATRAAQLKERKQRLALQLLDAAELYADAVTGVGTPKDGQLVAKALRDLLESHELLSGVSQDDQEQETRSSLMDLRDTMRAVRDGFESKYGVPFDSSEAAEIIKQEANQNDKS